MQDNIRRSLLNVLIIVMKNKKDWLVFLDLFEKRVDLCLKILAFQRLTLAKVVILQCLLNML